MKRFAREVLGKLGYRVEGLRYTPRQFFEPARIRRLEFDDVLCRHMFEYGQDIHFIQVGAYDGISTDPLRKYIEKYGWHGVMLEPQPTPATQLRDLYRKNSDIVILQAALDSERKKRSLFIVDSGNAPRWAGGMASFDRAHIVKHEYLVPGLRDMVREILVDCIPFDDVISHLPSDRIDLLQIDAEGADGYILSLFPFERVRPAILHWERKNMTRKQQEGALDLVGRYGYRIAPSGDEDMLAMRI